MYLDFETHLCTDIWKDDRSWFQIALACNLVIAAFPGVDRERHLESSSNAPFLRDNACALTFLIVREKLHLKIEFW
jgi:hypothetical protein